MSEHILPPAMTHGKNSKAILWGTIAGGGVLLYLFMHRSAAAQVAPATADTPADPVAGSPIPSYGSDGAGYVDTSTGDVTGDTPLTIGTTDVAPGSPVSGAHPAAPHRAKHKEVSHPSQVHANPVHHKNVQHKEEVMNSHHGGSNPAAHTAHHPSPTPASNHHRTNESNPAAHSQAAQAATHPAPHPAQRRRR